MLRFLRRNIRKALGDTRGNVAMLTALALPVVLGAAGVGAEAGSWITTARALQNAADAAAIAAATNAGSNYDAEAKGVAAKYGFKDGVNNVTVTASNAASCPAGAGAGPCFSVTVSLKTPLLLAQITGYRGDATVGNAPAKLISANAVAVQSATPRPYCLLALGSSGVSTALLTNGAPKANLSGCNVMSNTGATCNGHNLGADVGDAHQSNDGCGVLEHSNVPAVKDPYSSLASNIPADTTCNGVYPQEPKPNIVQGAVGWNGVQRICGDLQLSGDVTVANDTTLVIYNGQLDTNGKTLSSAAGVGLTIIFAGSNNNSYTHAPTGGGILDFAAPTSGTWSGIAIYQDPSLTQGVDISAAGNSPTWDITGAVYLPHSDVTFSGAVNKSSNGKSCFVMVADAIRINGTGSILAHGQCPQAGLDMPTGQVPARGSLVL